MTIINLDYGGWSREDWERSLPKLTPGKVCVVPMRHPDNDDTWGVGIYDPYKIEGTRGKGHRLRGMLKGVKVTTFGEAEAAVAALRGEA